MGKINAVSEAVLRTLRQSIWWISLPFFILSLLLPLYGRDIGASVVEIGLFFSAFSLMTVLLRPLVGRGIDRYGRKPFYLLGIGSYTLTWIAFAFIDQAWSIIAARAVQGIASAFLWLALNAVVADVASQDSRARAFGSITQSSSQGSIIGASIAMTIINVNLRVNGQGSASLSWREIFLFYAFASLIALLIAWRGLPETNPARKTRTASPPIHWTRPWALLLLVTAVTAASWSMVAPVLIIFLQDRLDIPVDQLAWAFLPAGLVWALLPSRLGTLADRHGRKRLMVIGLLGAAVVSFIIPSLANWMMLSGLWAALALFSAAGDPAEQALVADLTGNDQRGRAYGVYALAGGLGATVGPLGGAWLYQTLGPGIPFYANGLILTLCAMILWALLEEPAQRSPNLVDFTPDSE